MWWFSHHLKGFEASERLLLYEPQWENRLKTQDRSQLVSKMNDDTLEFSICISTMFAYHASLTVNYQLLGRWIVLLVIHIV